MVIVKGKNNPCGDDTLLNPKLQNYDTVRLQFTARQVFGAVAGNRIKFNRKFRLKNIYPNKS